MDHNQFNYSKLLGLLKTRDALLLHINDLTVANQLHELQKALKSYNEVKQQINSIIKPGYQI